MNRLKLNWDASLWKLVSFNAALLSLCVSFALAGRWSWVLLLILLCGVNAWLTSRKWIEKFITSFMEPSLFWFLLVLLAAGWRVLAPGAPASTAFQAGAPELDSAAAVGSPVSLPILLPVLAVLAGLVFWDLSLFTARTDDLKEYSEEHFRTIEKAHLSRLAVVTGVSVLLVLFGIFVTLDFSLGWAILLAIGALISLRVGIGALMKSGSPPGST